MRLEIISIFLAFCFVQSYAASEITVHNDVVFNQQAGKQGLLDIYLPSGEGPHPILLIIHGGGWVKGDKTQFVRHSKIFAHMGYATISTNYRLVPKHGGPIDAEHAYYPKNIEDCQRAVRWIRANAKKYKMNVKKFAVLGGSAGAHLASMVGVLPETLDTTKDELSKYSSRVDCVVNFFGPTYFENELGNKWAKKVMGSKNFNTKDPMFKLLSPVNSIDKNTPPFLILHGSEDTLVPINVSEILVKKLKEEKVPVTFIPIKTGHSFIKSFDMEWWQPVSKFLAKELDFKPRMHFGQAMPFTKTK
ncbi:MAG: alpha/beta hydrolase [Planctomycetes bacterium]|nr:alpha/beta hydrolase [Planctomycetota bacterium]